MQTEGEQSAAGLASTGGILVLNVPGSSALFKHGFHTGQVILKVQGMEIRNFTHFRQVMSRVQGQQELTVLVLHNQEETTLNLGQDHRLEL